MCEAFVHIQDWIMGNPAKVILTVGLVLNLLGVAFNLRVTQIFGLIIIVMSCAWIFSGY